MPERRIGIAVNFLQTALPLALEATVAISPQSRESEGYHLQGFENLGGL